ncbi:MAG: sodium:solute symporter [Bacteroidetes bacterium]|nr:sodium:solute symporter [Bacteroidota bacterium]
MSQVDWIVLIVTLLVIISYGLYKSRTTHNLDGYFLSNRSMPWGLILLSIMGTQASAITFLSAPGQAYTDGMRFVQYYFGIPLAMIVICIFFIPIFSRMKVYTAYEYLEQRFDGKTRTLTSMLFFLQRGLSTGISVFAPSIILSSLLHWNIYWTNLFMGGLLIIYTMTGGARAVAYTQQLQLIIIFTGMFLAGYMVVKMLPAGVSFSDALDVGGKLKRMNVITTGYDAKKGFDWSDQYNIWSGVIGGFFLALSYFGTDQSQVGRYLTGKSARDSRMGLLMNGIVKVPMQFFILLIGVLVFTFYQFNKAPLFFNDVQVQKIQQSAYKDSFAIVNTQYDGVQTLKKEALTRYLAVKNKGAETEVNVALDSMRSLQTQSEQLRNRVKGWLKSKIPGGDSNDTNYIFLRFVVDYLPAGLVGLLIAIIFLASWGSIAAAINSLASCTMIDLHRRFTKNKDSNETEYRLSKWYTMGWGIFCIIVAMFTYNIGNSLIEAVNILGSLFYGVILGVFLVAFLFKHIKSGTVVFWAAILAELLVLGVFILTKLDKPVLKMGFLWLNPIGVFGVIFFALILNRLLPQKKNPAVAAGF